MNRIQFLLWNTVVVCAVAAQPVLAQDALAQAAGHTQSAGAKIFGKWCGDCHSSAGGPGSMALQRKYQANLPAILEQRDDLAPDYVKAVVRHGISFMPSFRKTEISDAELTLLAAYLTPSQGGTHRVAKRPSSKPVGSKLP
jgi:mono/diheme cytochrome c family protein